MQTIDRNEIAKDINAKISGLGRNIRTNWELGFEEGQVITLEKQESWTDGGDFTVCNDCPVEYNFEIENETPCHIVDYTNKEEVVALGAEDCEDEKEVLLPAGTKLEVVYGECEDDNEEMGFYTVIFRYVRRKNKMAGFIKKYLENKEWTIYQLGNATGLAHQTIRSADSKTVDQLSAKNVRLIADVFGFTPGEILDEFYEIEEEINNDAIIQELINVFEKYGYNTDEISLELLDGEEIKLEMSDDTITQLADAVNATKHFTAYVDASTDFMIIEKI